MIYRLVGAAVRAFLVVLLIATPSLILPGMSTDVSQIVTLIAIFGAGLTFFEYASTYPGLVEFRDAPPFNRIRFGSLFVTVILLSLVTRGSIAPTMLTSVIDGIGASVGRLIDFPYSPVRLVVLMLPPEASVRHVQLVRDSAGIAYVISLATLAIFVVVQRMYRWPLQRGSFNVWINLPTFDPTAGGDVVERLERDARFNIALGFLLPFLTPAVIKSATALFGAVTLESPQTLIWTVAAWAFLPASLFMRGIAMGRIAALITEKRRMSSQDEGNAGLLPV
ncbi:hypothetical protein EF888_19640 [Silicimonas algicola]|uniref:Uncharacterized protein n=1 Tax=Silicimonas algicola TaxID=1826607 RepID=A0A316G350_9RHOB|nr:hypothetical protein [Silicimonas algicola]AZQ69148.1 hypothetical protein EF888_19640 [Silicimonas algicola]PWK55043.1 hypothetical protein C8D95_109131 [Silicimonas algicola]